MCNPLRKDDPTHYRTYDCIYLFSLIRTSHQCTKLCDCTSVQVQGIFVDIDGAMPTGAIHEMAVADNRANIGKHLHNLWIIHVVHTVIAALLSTRFPAGSPTMVPSR